MPTPTKAMESMDKHLTNQEKATRAQAEQDTLPDRPQVRLKPPPIMTGIPGASGFWKRTLERMEGLSILDDLDSDTLGVYCVMMARYKLQCDLLNKTAKALKPAGDDPDEVAKVLEQIDAISAKMTTLEKTILQYAERLGLTPTGRVRLAQKRAAAAQAAADPDGDLFGD